MAVWVENLWFILVICFFFFFGYLFYTKKFCEATELEPRFSPSFASELKEGPDQEGYIISSC